MKAARILAPLVVALILAAALWGGEAGAATNGNGCTMTNHNVALRWSDGGFYRPSVFVHIDCTTQAKAWSVTYWCVKRAGTFSPWGICNGTHKETNFGNGDITFVAAVGNGGWDPTCGLDGPDYEGRAQFGNGQTATGDSPASCINFP